MKKCPFCAEEIQDEAVKCKHCGSVLSGSYESSSVGDQPEPKKPLGCLAKLSIVAGGFFILLVFFSLFGSDSNSGSGSSSGVDDAQCRQDLKCWGDRHLVNASVACRRPVESLAKYSTRWTDGIMEPRFSRYRWKDKATGVLTYIGDRLELQNGFGAWQPHVYECDFDPGSKAVLDARAQPGRLPR